MGVFAAWEIEASVFFQQEGNDQSPSWAAVSVQAEEGQWSERIFGTPRNPIPDLARPCNTTDWKAVKSKCKQIRWERIDTSNPRYRSTPHPRTPYACSFCIERLENLKFAGLSACDGSPDLPKRLEFMKPELWNEALCSASTCFHAWLLPCNCWLYTFNERPPLTLTFYSACLEVFKRGKYSFCMPHTPPIEALNRCLL